MRHALLAIMEEVRFCSATRASGRRVFLLSLGMGWLEWKMAASGNDGPGICRACGDSSATSGYFPSTTCCWHGRVELNMVWLMGYGVKVTSWNDLNDWTARASTSVPRPWGTNLQDDTRFTSTRGRPCQLGINATWQPVETALLKTQAKASILTISELSRGKRKVVSSQHGTSSRQEDVGRGMLRPNARWEDCGARREVLKTGA